MKGGRVCNETNVHKSAQVMMIVGVGYIRII